MTKFEQIGVSYQNKARTKECAIKYFKNSCDICCYRGIHLDCDHCAIESTHKATIAYFDDIEGGMRK